MDNHQKSSFQKYASIVTELALDKILDYGIPDALLEKVQVGVQVEIPIRGHLRKGYVQELKDSPSYPKVFPIASVVSSDTLITADLFQLALWMQKYYCTPLERVLKVILPASVRKNVSHKMQYCVMRAKTKEILQSACISLRERYPSQAAILDIMLTAKKSMLLSELLEKAQTSQSPVDTLVKKGLLCVDIVRVNRSPLVGEDYFRTEKKVLSAEQKEALDSITKTLNEALFQTHLLFGVTGSGKTEVYLQAIEQALQLKKGTIMLVPEISLTAQTIERFRSRFEDKIAILHHQLSAGERYDEWHRIRTGEASIVVGARSAIFSPVQNLGLIIVDEEHDGAYKQSEEMPCYNARDVAVMRGKIARGTVILGSATPSLETYENTKKNKYYLHTLSTRVDVAKMPRVEIVDMKREFEKRKGYTSFSDALLEAISCRLERGEQTLLFLNRRGYHTSLQCKACGHIYKCPHCDISLTFHMNIQTLSCHLCSYEIKPLPKSCGGCQRSESLHFKGVGTEQIEKALHAIFPNVRTCRIDADTTRHKGSHEVLFRNFSTGKSDVLIGTQMVAKGLHFPNVTLVGILNSDAPLNLPDFRASEHVFQLITQVAGRAGRGAIAGEVIIQSHMPENNIIRCAAKQDFPLFYAGEIQTRKMFHYPPFTHFVKLVFSGEDQEETKYFGEKVRSALLKVLGKQYVVHPLTAAGYPKVKDRYRFQILVRGAAIYPITEPLSQLVKQIRLPKGIRLLIDVDPLSTFF